MLSAEFAMNNSKSFVSEGHTKVYPKVSGQSHDEINNNKHSLRTKGYGCKTH